MNTYKGRWYIIKHVSGVKVGIIGIINNQFVVSRFMPFTVPLSNYVNEWYYQVIIEYFDKVAHRNPKLLSHNLTIDKFQIIKVDVISHQFTLKELQRFVLCKYNEHVLSNLDSEGGWS